MNSKMENALYQSASLTFEKLGFLFPIGETAPFDNSAFGSDKCVSVDFYGDFHGRVVLNVSNDLLPIVAENILGDDETPSENLQLDALGEVANVICGNVLPMIFGEQSVIRLSAPQHGKSDRGKNNATKLVGEIRLGFDEGRANVRLYLAEAAVV